VCEQYLLERRRQVRSLREVEWADQRDAPSAPPPSDDVESLGEDRSAASNQLDVADSAADDAELGEYEEEAGEDAVTRIYDGEELEAEGPAQSQAWMHDSNPPEGIRQGWSRWAVVGLLGVLVAVASGAAVMASRSMTRSPQAVASAEARTGAGAAASAGSASATANQRVESEASKQAHREPIEEPSPKAGSGGATPTAALAALGGQAAEDATERASSGAERPRGSGGAERAQRPVLRRVAAQPKRPGGRATTEPAGRATGTAPAAAAEPATLDVADLPEAREETPPAAPAPPVAPARKAGSGADGDLVIEEAPKVAFLSVDADPYATVFIDGEKIGVTPLVRFELPPGLHRMVARAEDGRTKRFTLQLDPGKTEVVKVPWGEGE
jgi:serine/threonine-protein kinase